MSLFLNVGDLVGLVVFAIVAIFLLAFHTKRAIRQAFCHQCGKNLGFIGNMRKDTQ